jgi:hypothetical protein
MIELSSKGMPARLNTVGDRENVTRLWTGGKDP